MTEDAARISVLGLGIMGSALARDAARAGLAVTVWDRTAERGSALAAEGIAAAGTVGEATAQADVVVTMVSDADAVLDIMQERGAFASMKPGASWVQMSTIGVAGIERVIRFAATRPEIVLIDAPVSGSKGPAEHAKLLVLASGDRARAGAAVQRFFDAIGRTEWLGDAGAGSRMKLVFNAWMGVLIQDVAEVATLARELGVEQDRFIALATGGPLVPPWALDKLTKIARNQTREPEFPLRWAEKDVQLALDAAGEARVQLPILNDIAEIWKEALKDFGASDLSAIYLALQKRKAHIAAP